MSKTQNWKSKFRASSIWKNFRKKIMNKQKGIDPITKAKLYAGFNVHHLCLDENKYKDLTNEEDFVALNKKTHDFLHWAYTYYKKFGYDFIDIFVYYLDRMIELNKKGE